MAIKRDRWHVPLFGAPPLAGSPGNLVRDTNRGKR
jgi:hypothetical protein